MVKSEAPKEMMAGGDALGLHWKLTLNNYKARDVGDAAKAVELIGEVGMPVKRLFLLLDMAREDDDGTNASSSSEVATPLQGKEVNLARFMECLTDMHK